MGRAWGRPEPATGQAQTSFQEIVEGAMAGAADGMSRIASSSLRTEKIMDAYRGGGHAIEAVSDIRSLELRTIDGVKPSLDGRYLAAGALSGVSAGFVIAGGEAATLWAPLPAARSEPRQAGSSCARSGRGRCTGGGWSSLARLRPTLR